MLEIKFGPRSVYVPGMVRLDQITEKMFDRLIDPDTRAELIDGVMIVHSPTAMLHDDTSGFLFNLMNCFADERDLGRAYGPNCLFRPKKGRRYAPDIFFLRKSRIPSPLPKIFQGVPDWIVEVLSPTNRKYDLEEKRPIYRAHRVPEIWFVDPDRHFVLCDRLNDFGKYETMKLSEGKLESSALAGFWIDLSWLWKSPPPKVLRCIHKILAMDS